VIVISYVVERCSVTLVTLSMPFAFTCRICGRKMLDERALEEDAEWGRMVFGEAAGDGGTVPKTERCVYCAGEWYRKM
jgi:hypothetical protein